MNDADVPAAQQLAFESLSTMAVRYEGEQPEEEQPPERKARGQARARHLLATDPGGCWVAADGSDLTGMALSLRRDDFWFLSLLAVATDRQAQGIGRALMAACLTYAGGCAGGEILASPDPKALRRYAAAGFTLHPAYRAKGPLDRSLLPADSGVREGDLSADGALVDAIAGRVRGAPYGPDLEFFAARGTRLLLIDEPAGRGFAMVSSKQFIAPLGADSPAVAQRLLWAALGAVESPEASVEWLSADQQWAIDVCLAARLSLSAGPSRCTRGELGPLTPYLPSGAFG